MDNSKKNKKCIKNEDSDEDYQDNEEIIHKKNNKRNIKNDSEEEVEEKKPFKRLRSNSENDVYYYKIQERGKYDLYFRRQSRNKQLEIMEKENEIYKYFDTEMPIRYKILYSNLPLHTKSLIFQKIDLFEILKPSDCEYVKLSKWIKGLSLIPFDTYINLPVSLSDGDIKIQNFLSYSYEILKNTIYGQIEAKNKIMQVLAQWISNPHSLGQIIALEGPPGVGKTSLIKNGVSKVLNRPFSFYALGGTTDVSLLEGHSYTYEGANWGRMLEMLMESKVMNPVIFFDELDKISHTPKGNEISGLLTHLTDPVQNNVFHDKYFQEIDIDFSKVIFFFSFNNIHLINPILKDRLTIIKFNGYTIEEKILIVQDYLIPDLLKNIGFQKNDITIHKDTIKYIINEYTDNEDGVRNIKRIIEDLFLKINLLKLIKNSESKNKIDIHYNIDNLSFPLNITIQIVNNLIKNKK
jgi:ATP-dependent Lon protease